MTVAGWVQVVVLFVLVLVCVKPLGLYMAGVFAGERTFLTPVFGPLERLVYRICRIDPNVEMAWYTYLFAVLAFSFVSFVYLYVLLRTQQWLPLDPQGFGPMAPDLAWNTAVSFMTNTNWQFYSGENTLSYLSQMAGLAWHNFTSAALGIAVAVAFIRGLARTDRRTLGNFWADLTRASLYVLLPISILGTLLLVYTGVPQNFNAYQSVTSLEGFKQRITGGPMASQEVIKELGTNGGGFVGQNSAAPNENPTPLSDLIELWLMIVIAAALTYTFGRMVKDPSRLGAVRGDGDSVLRRSRRRLLGGGGRKSEHSRFGDRRREHGREGSSLRRRRLRAVGRGDDGDVVRCGERDARLVHRARRFGPAAEHAAR